MFRLQHGVRQAVRESAARSGSSAMVADSLEEQIIAAMRTVSDPEIPVNIYDLGLIYELAIGDDGAVTIQMTLTAPACPVAGTMPGLVEQAALGVDGVSSAHVELVWDPPWSLERMSEEARLQLGLL